MSGYMRMGWVRHGLTSWNKAGKIQGTTDIPLSAEGKMQAHRLAHRLSIESRVWHGVVCSDLQRAETTARIVAERLNIPLLTDVRLRERGFGEAEGTTEAERVARWGSGWRGKVPGQESDEQVRSRGLAFVEEFSDKHAGESWLVVTHGSFIGQMLQALETGVDDHHISNLSLTILDREGDRWVPILHNCTEHLNLP
ncbi:histidine phosphatase family protein [Cohnella thailandensis]|uniref:Histidine phosphatase family protein n=1 Tax=Cohnella thailandensis TaxID=557557 RepID=A0A841SZW0_9BACL|nr:histidine phosphatase family protein [Cohnella thailandensis]MBB6635370.1 histidine phosphatase family protein [Cohnella thailandensis]MBP1974750.1 putative phosphoglycerate mutase [Cohnella thailandensis]